MVFPAIESIHANFPEIPISLLISPNARGVLDMFPMRHVISDIIEYDLSGKHKGLLSKIPLIFLIRKKRYDLVYSPDRGEGMREEVLLSFMTGASYRLGFKRGKTGLLNTTSIEFCDDVPIIQQNLDILRAAGLRVTKQSVDITVSKGYIEEAKQLIGDAGLALAHPLITIHPGGTWNSRYKCWPPGQYVQLIKALIRDLGAKILIIGSKSEAATGQQIIEDVHDPSVICLTGKTSIPQMAAVIGLSDFFVGTDSGPLHLASVMGKPFVGIFGSTSPHQLLITADKGIVLGERLSCSPCYLHYPIFNPRCNDKDIPPCLKAISVDEVFAAVKKLVENVGGGNASRH